MSSPDLQFGTQLIGQTEKTLNAILRRLLAGSGVTEPQWVALNITLAAGETFAIDVLLTRVAGALHVDRDAAEALVADLEEHGFVERAADQVAVTPVGGEFHRGIRATVDQLTARLWGHLAEGELAATGRVLNAVLANARVELAALE